MPASKKPRKKYRTKVIDRFASIRPASSQTKFTESEITQLTIAPRLAIEAIRFGKGTHDDIDTITVIVNVALIRSEQIGGNNEPAMSACYEAMNALLQMQDRASRTKRVGFGIGELDAILPVVELHEQLVTLSTAKEISDAMKEVLRRISIGHVQHSRMEQDAS